MPRGRGLYANTSSTNTVDIAPSEASKRAGSEISTDSDASVDKIGKKPLRKKTTNAKTKKNVAVSSSESEDEPISYALKPDRNFYNLKFSDIKKSTFKTMNDGKTEVSIPGKVRDLPNFCVKYMQIEVLCSNERSIYLKPMNQDTIFTALITKPGTSMNAEIKIDDRTVTVKGFRMPLKFYKANQEWEKTAAKTYRMSLI